MQKNILTLAYHYDIGQGWLAVPSDQLSKVGMTTADFTTSSYVSGSGTLYLEEDYDAPLFLMAATEAGIDLHIHSSDDGLRSNIRNFQKLVP